jgi:phage shock protein A
MKNDLLSEYMRVEAALTALKTQRKELTGEIARRTKLVERYKASLLSNRAHDDLITSSHSPSPEIDAILREPWA